MSPEAPIEIAAQLILENKIGAVPVVEFCMPPLDWHWDLQGTELDFTGYRSVLRSLFQQVGFP